MNKQWIFLMISILYTSGSGLYPNNLKNRYFDCAKALGLNDFKSLNIRNIERLKVVQSQELSHGPNADFSGYLGINAENQSSSQKNNTNHRSDSKQQRSTKKKKILSPQSAIVKKKQVKPSEKKASATLKPEQLPPSESQEEIVSEVPISNPILTNEPEQIEKKTPPSISYQYSKKNGKIKEKVKVSLVEIPDVYIAAFEEDESDENIRQALSRIDSSPCDRGPHSNTIAFSHREGNGIGYKSGYSSLSAFISNSSFESRGFLDLRAHFFNDGNWAGNAGVGVRTLAESLKLVFGLNAYYDYRQAHHHPFHQVGAGFEVLGINWDFRANGYFPIFHRRHIYRKNFAKFFKHQALFSRRYDFDFIGGDIEIGRNLCKLKNFNVHTSLGGYYFSGLFDKQAIGGLFKLSTEIFRCFRLEGQASYDSLFKSIFQGQATLSFSFGGRDSAPYEKMACRNLWSLESRFVEPVDRFEIIVMDKHRKKNPALNPLTHQPLFFIFVNNQSNPSLGNGSIEDPFATLTQAQHNSAPGNVIYVFSGDGTSNGMNQGIILQNNQWLQGSGTPMPVFTGFGLNTIPAQTLNSPLIAQLGTNPTVTLTNQNTVNGFNIQASSVGIEGGNINGTTITNNIFLSSVPDIILGSSIGSGFIGTAIIHNNISQNGQGVQFNTSSLSNLEFNQNIFTTLTLNVSGSALFTGNIDSNQLQTLSGAFLNSSVTSLNITNNLSLNSLSGVGALALNTSNQSQLMTNIFDNQIINSQTAGMLITSNGSSTLIADIENNSIVNADQSNIGEQGLIMSASGTSQASLRLFLNNSTAIGAGGYSLLKSSTASFNVQSPNLMLSGLALINSGTFDPPPVGQSPTFVPFSP